MEKTIKKQEPAGSPEQCLTGFLLSWQKLDWTEMSKFCQKSWIPKNEVIDNRDLLKRQRIKLGQPPLTDAEMESVEPFIIVSAEEQLKARFSPMKLHLWHIQKVFMDDGLDANVILDSVITIKYQSKGFDGRWKHQVLSNTIHLRMVKEKAYYEPSIDGDWGLNPNSFRIF